MIIIVQNAQNGHTSNYVTINSLNTFGNVDRLKRLSNEYVSIRLPFGRFLYMLNISCILSYRKFPVL